MYLCLYISIDILLWVELLPQNSYVEVLNILSTNVTVFENKVFKNVIRLK